MATIDIYQVDSYPGCIVLQGPYNSNFHARLKSLGGRWAPDIRSWRISEPTLPVLQQSFPFWSWRDNRKFAEVDRSLLKGLHPYQIEGVKLAVAKGTAMFAFEMGLGKTLAALRVGEAIGASDILIVCPAIVREVWRDEIAKWTPSWTKYLSVVHSGKSLCNTPIVVTSPELIRVVGDRKWDQIIFDESAMFKSYKSKRSKQALSLRKLNPKANVLALTGTPITIEPKDTHNQLNLLQPDGWGSWGKYVLRYCNVEPNPYSDFGEVWGINEEHEEELKDRLAGVVVRATKAQYGHLLPPIITKAIRLGYRKQKINIEDFESNWEKLLEDTASVKVQAALKWLADEAPQGVILTWLKSTARDVAREAGIEIITGDIPVAERKQRIEALEGEPFVATMASIETGLNLQKWSDVAFIELYPSPKVMSQVMSRFWRLGSQKTVTATFFLGTAADEAIAEIVGRRIEDIDRTVMATEAEKHIRGALLGSDDEWKTRILEALR